MQGPPHELGQLAKLPSDGRLRALRLELLSRDAGAPDRRAGAARLAQAPCGRPGSRNGRPGTMKPRHKRFAMIAGGLVALGAATAFVLAAFRENLVFFFTPSRSEEHTSELQ